MLLRSFCDLQFPGDALRKSFFFFFSNLNSFNYYSVGLNKLLKNQYLKRILHIWFGLSWSYLSMQLKSLTPARKVQTFLKMAGDLLIKKVSNFLEMARFIIDKCDCNEFLAGNNCQQLLAFISHNMNGFSCEWFAGWCFVQQDFQCAYYGIWYSYWTLGWEVARQHHPKCWGTASHKNEDECREFRLKCNINVLH